MDCLEWLEVRELLVIIHHLPCKVAAAAAVVLMPMIASRRAAQALIDRMLGPGSIDQRRRPESINAASFGSCDVWVW